ncbi:MAG: DNA-directed DNA polymerase II small subunit [Promethearchaeia archaeon]
MITKQSEQFNSEFKRTIVNRFVSSGINITPKVLSIITSLDDPLKKVDIIIKETSFIPDFNGHITEQTLTKISNNEIKKVLKRIIFKDSIHEELKIKEDKKKQLKKEIKIEKEEKFKFHSPAPQLNSASIRPKIKAHTKSDSITTNKKKSIHQKERKNKSIDNKIFQVEGSIKSKLAFKPIAKEYDFDYKILKDPTKNLYTNGEYEDFYQLMVDRFNKLRKLMRKRSEALSANNIGSLNRLSNKVEVSVMGFVDDLRETKNGNFYFTVEDLTGKTSVLLRNSSDNQDSIKIIKYLVNDQMIFVKGLYTPKDKKSGGIIYANYITKIDIPTNYSTNKSNEPLSIVLLSDLHIGSKEFEKNLWEKFIDFINGRINNTKLREIAGRIKYIIINGDLVDGIGVYPNQKEDLIITDIYEQYSYTAELLSEIPDYIKIFYTSGNHEPVRNAIPRPAVPKYYCDALLNLDIEILGNPCLIQTNNVKTLAFHGDSLFDMNLSIQSLTNEKPAETMKELLRCRHLAPIYGKKTQIAPTPTDHLVIDEIPDIFHTGHVHINGLSQYRNVTLVNSGCLQTQTDYMKSFGINPTPGIIPIIELDSLKPFELNLNKL